MNVYSSSWFDAIRQQNDQDLVQIVQGYDSQQFQQIVATSGASIEALRSLWQYQTPQNQCIATTAVQTAAGPNYGWVRSEGKLDAAVDQTLFFDMQHCFDELGRLSAQRELERRGWKPSINGWVHAEKNLSWIDGEFINQ